jgi:hypothetical protein
MCCDLTAGISPQRHGETQLPRRLAADGCVGLQAVVQFQHGRSQGRQFAERSYSAVHFQMRAFKISAA